MHILTTSFRVLPVVQLFENIALTYRNMASTIKSKVNFNTKHLKKGDPLPPYTGKLRVYNMRYCPYAQRTILALNAKNIDYEVVNINLVDKPEWLPSKSAFGKVPAIEIKENVSIYESLITVEYLDEVYPQRPLLSKDPVRKAFDKIIVEAAGPIHALFYRVIRNVEVTDDAVKAYNNALEFIQDQLKSRGSKFLSGSEPGFADYMIWPWFERILLMVDEAPALKIDAQKFKLLLEYFKNMEQDPAISQYLVPKEIFRQVMAGYSNNPPNPNYDLLTENN